MSLDVALEMPLITTFNTSFELFGILLVFAVVARFNFYANLRAVSQLNQAYDSFRVATYFIGYYVLCLPLVPKLSNI